MASLALKAEKRNLRKAMTAKLRDVSSIPEQSRAVTAKVLSLPSFVKSNSVSCYLSMPSGEVDTSALVREILRSGKTLFVPKIDTTAEGRMELLQIYDVDDLNSLPAGVWGIKEPKRLRHGQSRTNANDAGLDMIIVPGLAFDRSLSRLGHGKGYYDRFITAYTAGSRPPPLLVGLALREQLLDADTIPIADHDWKMDHIITDQEEVSRL
ncbi:5-formyltetrahydrofolate cyclo-ligase, partial [Mycena pura]